MPFLQYYIGYKSFWCLVFVYPDKNFDNAFIERMPLYRLTFILEGRKSLLSMPTCSLHKKRSTYVLFTNKHDAQRWTSVLHPLALLPTRNSGMHNSGEIETKGGVFVPMTSLERKNEGLPTEETHTHTHTLKHATYMGKEHLCLEDKHTHSSIQHTCETSIYVVSACSIVRGRRVRLGN